MIVWSISDVNRGCSFFFLVRKEIVIIIIISSQIPIDFYE